VRSLPSGRNRQRSSVTPITIAPAVATPAPVHIVVRRDAPEELWLVMVPIALFAAIYVWLLFRGPFERDFQSQARSG
jgi:hypothetical protein